MKTYIFKKLFGFDFGEKRKKKVYPDRNAHEYRIKFRTPSRFLRDVRFQRSVMAFVFDKKKMLRVYDGDQLLIEHNFRLQLFSDNTGGCLEPDHDYIVELSGSPKPNKPIEYVGRY